MTSERIVLSSFKAAGLGDRAEQSVSAAARADSSSTSNSASCSSASWPLEDDVETIPTSPAPSDRQVAAGVESVSVEAIEFMWSSPLPGPDRKLRVAAAAAGVVRGMAAVPWFTWLLQPATKSDTAATRAKDGARTGPSCHWRELGIPGFATQ